MKDYLKEYDIWNSFPRNPVQTTYLRFMKKPQTGLDTEFNKMQREFQEIMKKPLKVKENILEGDRRI